MSFEEDFPSLAVVYFGDMDDVINAISLHCLDKQRVKETILKICGQEGTDVLEPLGEKLLKELGLDK